MKELHIDWDEFTEKIQSGNIKPIVDLNKGHALMKSPIAPKNWRLAIKIMTWISLFLIPVSIILFFFLKWWIPVILIVTSFMLTRAIRSESAKAVIETSISDENFYSKAIISGTMRVYSKN